MESNFQTLIIWLEDSLKNHPEDWSSDKYEDHGGDQFCIINGEIELWMISGFFFFRIQEPSNIKFGAYWKIRLWFPARKIWKRIKKQGGKELKSENVLKKILTTK